MVLGLCLLIFQALGSNGLIHCLEIFDMQNSVVFSFFRNESLSPKLETDFESCLVEDLASMSTNQVPAQSCLNVSRL